MQDGDHQTMNQPLDGYRVLDLTRLLPGAITTMMLADLGAAVIKIEDPQGGDYARVMGPTIDGQSVFFRVNNRNKRSAIVNLKTEAGRDVLRRLVQSADVLVESFRPGVMARLGCDADALRALNPRLVTCSLSGWGLDGPYAQRPQHDLNYIAAAGLLAAAGSPQPPGGQMADVGGALVAVGGILAALLRRERTGSGGVVDASLGESALPFVMYTWVEALTSGASGGQGMLVGGLACYQVYRAGDGEAVALAALEPKFWDNFCRAVERPDLLDMHLAPARQDELRAELRTLFAQRTADEWADLLEDADCCFNRCIPPAELDRDPHHRARGNLGRFDDGTPWMRSPLRLSDSEPVISNEIPNYGEHTRSVLEEAGYTPAQIDELAAQGAVGLA